MKQIRLIKAVILPYIYYEKISDGPHANQTIRELSALQLDNDEGHDSSLDRQWHAINELLAIS